VILKRTVSGGCSTVIFPISAAGLSAKLSFFATSFATSRDPARSTYETTRDFARLSPTDARDASLLAPAETKPLALAE
jgi:hypothetical protein